MKSIYADKYQQIGLKIAYYRKLRGLTQEQLAERLELSPAFIGHVEAPTSTKPCPWTRCLTWPPRWTCHPINSCYSMNNDPYKSSIAH